MKKACFQIFFFYFLLKSVVIGQPTCKVEYYSTEQGLSHQRVTAMLKDHEGFMWFGSWNGINRFDGREFISYKSTPGDRFQLHNDRIIQLADDSCGNIWVLAYDNQVYRFSKQTEQFFPLANLPIFKERKFVFRSMLSVSKHAIWLQTVNEGFFTFNLPIRYRTPLLLNIKVLQRLITAYQATKSMYLKKIMNMEYG